MLKQTYLKVLDLEKKVNSLSLDVGLEVDEYSKEFNNSVISGASVFDIAEISSKDKSSVVFQVSLIFNLTVADSLKISIFYDGYEINSETVNFSEGIQQYFIMKSITFMGSDAKKLQIMVTPNKVFDTKILKINSFVWGAGIKRMSDFGYISADVLGDNFAFALTNNNQIFIQKAIFVPEQIFKSNLNYVKNGQKAEIAFVNKGITKELFMFRIDDTANLFLSKAIDDFAEEIIVDTDVLDVAVANINEGNSILLVYIKNNKINYKTITYNEDQEIFETDAVKELVTDIKSNFVGLTVVKNCDNRAYLVATTDKGINYMFESDFFGYNIAKCSLTLTMTSYCEVM